MKSDPKLAEILKPIWNKYCGIYPELKSFEMPVIRLDGRLKMLAYNYPELNVIRVSKYWYPANKALYASDILPHELAHQIDFILNGDQEESHNANWELIMLDYGIEPLTTYEAKQNEN